MQRERIFEIAKAAGFKRIKECCPGVPNKLCSNDHWKGDLSFLVAGVVREAVEEERADFARRVVNRFNQPITIKDPYLTTFEQEGKQQMVS